jgi:exonuclease SbcC
VASEVLQSMTEGRYGSDGEFRVVESELLKDTADGEASVPVGEPRDPKTLSGGETFLASLSLALGMMELTGRRGGRLESFFLDEGLGSLDPEALELALAELSERGRSTGRMIGVISQVPEVAEHVRATLMAGGSAQSSPGAVLVVSRRGDGSSIATFEDPTFGDSSLEKRYDSESDSVIQN